MISLFALLPVVLFLGCLYYMDSFKLVRMRLLLLCLGWGITAAVLALLVNGTVADYYSLSSMTVSRFVAPVTEEVIKLTLVFYLVLRLKVGFIIDAAICGFAIGTGFAVAENLWYYLQLGEGFDLLLAVVRGFGTALMHGGTVALGAIILIEGAHRNRKAAAALLGLFGAIFFHALFNQFVLNPLLQTLLIISLLPLALFLIFLYANKNLSQWLEIEFNNEVELLAMIRKGEFKKSRAGTYLASIRDYFPKETIFDMYCFVGLWLELSIKAKRNMLLKESGIPMLIEEDIPDKITELKLLRRQIGKAGEMALMPLIRLNYRDLWQLEQWEETQSDQKNLSK